MSANLPAFILHHKPLEYRKQSLVQDLLQINFPYKTTWVEGYDPRSIYYGHPLTGGEVSISSKHYHVLNRQIEDSIEYALILEDDVDLLSVSNPIEFIENCFIEMKQTGGDICWLGGTKELNLREDRKPDQHLYYRSDYLSRCVHAYIINLRTAKVFVQNYHFNNQVDILYNHLIQAAQLKSGWADPFFFQKSLEGGDWKSSLR